LLSGRLNPRIGYARHLQRGEFAGVSLAGGAFGQTDLPTDPDFKYSGPKHANENQN
jgi:hypothetical protein